MTTKKTIGDIVKVTSGVGLALALEAAPGCFIISTILCLGVGGYAGAAYISVGGDYQKARRELPVLFAPFLSQEARYRELTLRCEDVRSAYQTDASSVYFPKATHEELGEALEFCVSKDILK